MVVSALRAHFDKQTASKKALLLSFHGPSGTGKNYVADFIAKSLYTKGMDSRFVHLFKGRMDFPYGNQGENYSVEIKNKVEQAAKECSRSLFIFDEVEKMPNGTFESLASLADYNSASKTRSDYTKLIFVFLSNTAGYTIIPQLSSLLNKGTAREATKESDFEEVLEKEAYNTGGGMSRASLIENNLIDHYIPFLPLEKRHLVKCLEAEFKHWNQTPDPEIIETIINEHISFDETGLFARSGCKKLDKKVAAEVKRVRKREEL